MDIAQEQVWFDSKLAKVQQLRDTERFQLIEHLFEGYRSLCIPILRKSSLFNFFS